jgi:2,4-dienoyl-CoA reductase-like NADH-dependent reductase (Old Yellow Enzyme family)
MEERDAPVPPIFASELRLGPLRLRNRFVMSAMGSGLGDPSGRVNERLRAYLERRAEGGVAMVVVESTAVTDAVRYTPRQPSLARDDVLPSWQELARRIHLHGALLCVQLQHPGRQTVAATTGEVVAPSPLPLRVTGIVPRELTVPEIRTIVRQFGEAAARARAAGADAVEIHAGHGYLFTQFLSPYANVRTDSYGGSLANRFRFLREAVEAIQGAAGADFPILVRLSVVEYVEGGIELPESLAVARWLMELGVVALRVSGGSNDQRLPVMIPPTDAPRGVFWELSRIVRNEVGIPVDAVGRIQSPSQAERLLREGYADFISLARPLLADPDFVLKALAGREEEIRPCIACNQGCIDRLLHPDVGVISCLMNPEVGREVERLTVPRGDRGRQRVVVVGGGPAGLEAARAAAALGHRVWLLEQEAVLGGEFARACRPPGKQDFAAFLRWFPSELKRMGVEVALNTRATVDAILHRRPDVVVWAAGAERLPPLPFTTPAVSVRELFDRQPEGRRAVVLGTEWEGAEVALFLRHLGFDVTAVEPGPKFGARLSPVTRRWYLRQQVEAANVPIFERASAIRDEGGVVAFATEEGRQRLPCDFVVYEGIRRPIPPPPLPANIRVVVIGDARHPRGAYEAMWEGFEAALAIREEEEPWPASIS